MVNRYSNKDMARKKEEKEMRNAKRWLALSLAGVMTVGMFAGCGSKSETKDDTAASRAAGGHCQRI